MSSIITDVVIGVFFTTLNYAPLLIFAGLGEIVAEKSGVVNLGIEGLMLMGAFTTYSLDLLTGNPWVGLFGSLVVAAIIGGVFSFITIGLYLDQIVSGLGVYLFGLGFSYVLYDLFTRSGHIGSFRNISPVFIPFVSDIPVVGKILFQQNVLVYLSLILVPAVAYFLRRTSLGLRIRAVGENPKAADNMGINVKKTRFMAVMFGSLMAGLAGAYFEFGFLQSFQFNIILGRGFVALAMIYFANWSPYRLLFVALVYEIVDALQSEIVSLGGPLFQTSSQLFNMLPYVFVLALIPVFGRKARAPKYLTVPYKKG